MLVSEYDEFVRRSDYSRDRSLEERRSIAIYGISAEIGSVISAIKKKLLNVDSNDTWNLPNPEIVEELGDVVWYCFALAQAQIHGKPFNILAYDISNLKKEIGASDSRADKIRRTLDPTKRAAFLKAAETFPSDASQLKFSDYQQTAFLTARTADRTLVEVCLAVLWQLGAELLRHTLPAIELELNKSVADRPINRVLGEVAWHLAALASSYGLDLGDVAKENMKKVAYRQTRNNPTPLHDEGRSEGEQIPRKFEIAFVAIGEGRARMYYQGRQLGDDLTDNAYDNDGYRYHDVMHLVNAAKLGWSPVLRSMLGRKRKSDKRLDEVEDGARAKIVEEAVIKAIHSEGIRLARIDAPDAETANQMQLFRSRTDISSRFLNIIRSFVTDLEVHDNKHWEWEDAIIDGHELFFKLRNEGQGTVTVDLENRKIEFDPLVCIDVDGRVAGLGSSYQAISPEAGFNRPANTDEATADVDMASTAAAQKSAVLRALGLNENDLNDVDDIQITDLGSGRISVRARGAVRSAMWDRQIVAFRTTFSRSGGAVHCTAIAMSDR